MYNLVCTFSAISIFLSVKISYDRTQRGVVVRLPSPMEENGVTPICRSFTELLVPSQVAGTLNFCVIYI